MQASDICISEEDNRLLDSSPESPSLATSCHGSESELQEEVVAIDGISTVSSRQFAPAQERRGAVRGKGKGRISRHSHTTGQRNRKITKRTCKFRVCCL